jgi:hypothetical protein
VPNAAASANIVGKLELGKDGDETVLQRKKRPSAHVHFRPEAIKEFAFTFVDPGFGAQPCLELRTRDGAAAVRLYYQGKKAARRFEEFAERTRAHAEFVKGTWLAPAEAVNEGIFVAGDGGQAGAGEAEEEAEVNPGAVAVEEGDAAVDESVAEVDEGGAEVNEGDAGVRATTSQVGDEGEAAEVVNAS